VTPDFLYRLIVNEFKFFLHPWCYQNPTDMLLKQSLLKGSSVADEKTKTHYRYFHNGKFAHQNDFILL
jgi:hypothetical protein